MLPLDRELAQLAFRRCLASRARSKKVKRNTDGHSIVLGIGGKAKAASEYHKTSAAQRVSEMFDFPVARVRNFSIIAHIDHGKSTLADRLLELTGTIPMKQGGNKQVMDNLQVEQERGITVKAQTASVIYTGCTGEKFLLNLIDTPGHVDFGYEVSCSLAACDGTLLVVDASQGVQAQTLANFFLAFERGLHIIPVINKIDLPHAQVERVMAEMVSCFDVSEEEIIKVSAKSGHGCEAVLSAVIDRIPPPNANQSEPFKGLIFDSWYDGYRGIINLVEVMSGELRRGDKLVVASTGRQYDAIEVGVLHPKQMPTKGLGAGQMGYIVTGMKDSAETRVGDTLFDADHAHGLQPFPGFKPARSMVWAGLYPIDQSEHDALVAGLDRLCLNDSSVSVRRQTSPALGPGFRLGFLGMLHMDVFRQRLEQEHSIETIFTTPSVSYRCRERDGTERTIECPSEFPTNHGHVLLEPMVIGTLVFPEQFTGRIIQLCQERRGEQKDMSFISSNRVLMRYRLPLNEVVEDFSFVVKSATSGYASFDYEDDGYEESDLVKLSILLNSEIIDALSVITHASTAQAAGKAICIRLKETIGRQLFDVAIQARAKGKIIARETVKAMRKDVTAKCYGGDVSRKKKLLNQQKEGKKRMRMLGNVEVHYTTHYL